jgi:hypothetical protein
VKFFISGRTAFIGVGFSDRSDSFDLNVALQDHFKWVKKEEEIEKEKETPKPELDLRFKEGETIKINMKITVSGNIRSKRLSNEYRIFLASCALYRTDCEGRA